MITPASNRHDGSTSTELVLLTPAVLTLVMLVVHLALWQHAQQVAAAAAEEGLAVTQAVEGTDEDGRARSISFLAEAGGLVEASVEAVRTGRTARVIVSGIAPAAIPGWDISVTSVAEGPIEQFVSEIER